MFKKLNKKSLIYLIIGIIVFLIVFSVIYFFYLKPKPTEEKPLPAEKTLEEIIKDLTAPAGKEIPQVPEETIKDLTAPKADYQVPEEIIKDLTAPE